MVLLCQKKSVSRWISRVTDCSSIGKKRKENQSVEWLDGTGDNMEQQGRIEFDAERGKAATAVRRRSWKGQYTQGCTMQRSYHFSRDFTTDRVQLRSVQLERISATKFVPINQGLNLCFRQLREIVTRDLTNSAISTKIVLSLRSYESEECVTMWTDPAERLQNHSRMVASTNAISCPQSIIYVGWSWKELKM